jgi:hypothetical protein
MATDTADYIKWGTYKWITGFLILGIISAIGFTANVQGQHESLAKEEDVKELAETVNEIENKQVEVVTTINQIQETQHEMKEQMKEDKREILKAIKEIR